MAAATERLTVYGMVQGVGFRPFVARLAEEMGVRGIVRNRGGIVTAEVTAEQGVLDRFVERLEGECPFGGAHRSDCAGKTAHPAGQSALHCGERGCRRGTAPDSSRPAHLPPLRPGAPR